MTNHKAIDTPSFKGSFGWERLGSELDCVPVIMRTNETRYCPTRIVEQEIIKKYASLPPSVFTCITLKSFYLTTVEARLLNEINIQHCDRRYGSDFFTSKDVIISAEDIKGLVRYLNIARDIFSNKLHNHSSLYGLIKLTTDPLYPDNTILVPYITKNYNGQRIRFIPAKLVESFVAASHATIKGTPNDWDIMYFKLLCVYAETYSNPNGPNENKPQQDISKDGRILSLTGLFYKKTQGPIIYQDCDQ